MQAPEFSAAAMRNSEPILAVLRTELDDCHTVFEIGSGTAQHAMYFCTAMPQLDWQTSDLAEYHDVIRTRLADADLPNVREPLLVDLEAPPAIDSGYDAVYSCNTMHIMSMAAVRNLFPFVAHLLRPGGLFCYYGAFRRHGGYTTDSNAEFDRSLQARHPHMGLRDLEDIGVLAATAGLQRERTYAMPSNNLLVIWSRRCSVSE
jgi:cyclopropane fatty-acyl-phospholipid synthase-like methyltransferase